MHSIVSVNHEEVSILADEILCAIEYRRASPCQDVIQMPQYTAKFYQLVSSTGQFLVKIYRRFSDYSMMGYAIIDREDYETVTEG